VRIKPDKTFSNSTNVAWRYASVVFSFLKKKTNKQTNKNKKQKQKEEKEKKEEKEREREREREENVGSLSRMTRTLAPRAISRKGMMQQKIGEDV